MNMIFSEYFIDDSVFFLVCRVVLALLTLFHLFSITFVFDRFKRRFNLQSLHTHTLSEWVRYSNLCFFCRIFYFCSLFCFSFSVVLPFSLFISPSCFLLFTLSLSLSPSVSLALKLSVSMPFCLSVSLSLCPSVSLDL